MTGNEYEVSCVMLPIVSVASIDAPVKEKVCVNEDRHMTCEYFHLRRFVSKE